MSSSRKDQSRQQVSPNEREELLQTLEERFESNMKRHEGLEWSAVLQRLLAHSDKLWSLKEMERTGGEPDVIGQDAVTGAYLFCDCSAESPKERRSLCYDRDALESRKEAQPKDNALDMAEEIGIELLTEEQYRELQQHGTFDAKTSSWLRTPPSVRKLGGALFGDYRFGRVFIYHNGAQSYYAARGFRGILHV